MLQNTMFTSFVFIGRRVKIEPSDIAEMLDAVVSGRDATDEGPAGVVRPSSGSEVVDSRPRYWQIVASTAGHMLDIDDSRPNSIPIRRLTKPIGPTQVKGRT